MSETPHFNYCVLPWVVVGSTLMSVGKRGSAKTAYHSKIKTTRFKDTNGHGRLLRTKARRQTAVNHTTGSSCRVCERGSRDPGIRKVPASLSKSSLGEAVEPQLQGNILDERIADLNVQFRMGKIEGCIDDKQGRITPRAAFARLRRNRAGRRGRACRQILALMANTVQTSNKLLHLNNLSEYVESRTTGLEVSYSAVNKWNQIGNHSKKPRTFLKNTSQNSTSHISLSNFDFGKLYSFTCS